MSLGINPLQITLEEMGVTASQFTHHTPAHGAGHVNRVIYLSLLLCKTMGWPELMPAAWAAAYIHDLSRRGDGPDPDHGMRAVEEQIIRHLTLFRKVGVRREDYFDISEAVSLHCTKAEGDNRILRILKDADALDRVRFDAPDALDPKMLRLEHSPYFVQQARRLFVETHTENGDQQFPAVWDKAVLEFNPHIGLAATMPDEWDEEETPANRAMRRALQGQYGSRIIPHLMSAPLWLLVEQWFDAVPGLCNHFPKVPELLASMPDPLANHAYTFMREESYVKFLQDGQFQSLWELRANAWHSCYNDFPKDGRAFTERRLYGEKALHLTCGVLLDPNNLEAMSEKSTALARMYGTRRIEWDDSVLKGATFTLGDSQSNASVMPYSHSNLQKVMTLRLVMQMAVTKGLDYKRLEGWHPYLMPLNFIETQIHARLTPGDVADSTLLHG